MQALRKLNLFDNEIGPSGAQYLAEGLQQNTVRLSFSLSFNLSHSTLFDFHIDTRVLKP